MSSEAGCRFGLPILQVQNEFAGPVMPNGSYHQSGGAKRTMLGD